MKIVDRQIAYQTDDDDDEYLLFVCLVAIPMPLDIKSNC